MQAALVYGIWWRRSRADWGHASSVCAGGSVPAMVTAQQTPTELPAPGGGKRWSPSLLFCWLPPLQSHRFMLPRGDSRFWSGTGNWPCPPARAAHGVRSERSCTLPCKQKWSAKRKGTEEHTLANLATSETPHLPYPKALLAGFGTPVSSHILLLESSSRKCRGWDCTGSTCLFLNKHRWEIAVGEKVALVKQALQDQQWQSCCCTLWRDQQE